MDSIVGVFSAIELYELFVYFGNYTFVVCMVCKCFLLVRRFPLLMVSFAVQKLVSFDKVLLFMFAFIFSPGD